MANLNEAQLKAINSEAPVVLVIAGAGSGKTTVLTQKITKLVSEDDIKPWRILAITFTNKASKEMKERLNKSLVLAGSSVEVCTFHSFALKLIKMNTEFLMHHDRNFTIADEDDKKRILKRIIKELDVDVKVNTVMYNISSAKAFCQNKEDIQNLIDPEFILIFQKYQDYLAKHNAFDFDDLLIYCYELLKIEKVKLKYQEKFDNIHVDEFQDTSIIQAKILKLLKSDTNKLFIVGDVDQSIYEWRGATISNIMNIEKEFDDVELIKLEQNYRSSANILDSANNLIKNNSNRYDKNLITTRPPGEKVKAHRFADAQKEAEFIQFEVKYLLDLGRTPTEIAILYRYNYQSKKIEESLMRAQIPYQVYGGIRFYERLEIKDTLCYLRLIFNQNDNLAFLRVINAPKRSIGAQTLNKIISYSEANNLSYFAAVSEMKLKATAKFVNVINEYHELLVNDFEANFDDLLKTIGYRDFLLKTEDPGKVDDRFLNIDELKYSIIEALKEGDLDNYLKEIVLFSENDSNQSGVILSTVHGVKGLEYDNVFIVGLNEDKFPKYTESEAELEEERRVFYVALTRARKKVVISNIEFDFRGNMLRDSRFINEMQIATIVEKRGFSIF